MSAPSKERFKVRFAGYVIFRRGEEILMCRRINTGHEDGNYGLVQGHVDGGETVQQAMSRETKEEVGLDVRPEDLKVVHMEHAISDDGAHEYICVYMEALKWSGEPRNLEPDKCDDLRFFPRNKLPPNTIGYIRKMLDDVDAGVIYSNRDFIR